MHRIHALFAAVALGGCVTTPDYRYAGGHDDYYADDAYAGTGGVYIGGYAADDYYRYYDAGYYGYTQSWPWYAYGCPGYGFGWYANWGCGGIYSGYNPFLVGFDSTRWGWGSYGGFGGYPWGGYWNSWAYVPNYYWFVERPDRHPRDIEGIHAEKVRYVGRGNAAYRGTASSIAGVHAARAGQVRAARDTQRDGVHHETVRREAARRSTTWHRSWPRSVPARNIEHRPVRAPVDVPSRDNRADAFRQQVTRPEAPRGWPERRPMRSAPAPTVTRMPVHHAPAQPTVTRTPSAPTRSYRPAPRVQAAPVTRTRHSNSARSPARSAPRGRPNNDD